VYEGAHPVSDELSVGVSLSAQLPKAVDPQHLIVHERQYDSRGALQVVLAYRYQKLQEFLS
jgi:hypothetical protein